MRLNGVKTIAIQNGSHFSIQGVTVHINKKDKTLMVIHRAHMQP